MHSLPPRSNPRVFLYPKQVDFLDSTARFAAFAAGIGSGKSFVLCYNRLKNLARHSLYMVLAPTYPMLRDSTLRSFLALCRQLETPFEYAKSEHRLTFPRSGAEVLFRSADNPETLRGPNLAGIDMDEASLMPEEVYDIAIGRLRQGTQIGTLRAAFTPKGPTHWTHEVFNTGRPDTAIIRARTDENPFLLADFAATVARQYGDTAWARQELGGEFVQIEGAEFPVEWFDYKGFWFESWPTAGIVAHVLFLDPSKGRGDRPADHDYQANVRAVLVREPTATPGVYNNVIYLDAEMDKEPVPQMVARSARMCRDFRPDWFEFESNATMDFMLPEVLRQFEASGVVVPVMPVEHTQPKIQRIRVLGGYLNQRQIRIRNTPGGRLLRAQLGDFPLGIHDDGCDAAAGAIARLAQLVQG